MNPQETERADVTRRVEELLLSAATPRVTLRPELRQQVLHRAARAHRIRWRLRQIRALAVSLLVFTATWLTASYAISALQSHANQWIARATRPASDRRALAAPAAGLSERTEWAPASATASEDEDSISVEELLESGDPRAALNFAIQQPDAWALVDAYGALRQYYRRILLQTLWQ